MYVHTAVIVDSKDLVHVKILLQQRLVNVLLLANYLLRRKVPLVPDESRQVLNGFFAVYQTVRKEERVELKRTAMVGFGLSDQRSISFDSLF
jgi:hypothetical protein